MNKLWGTSHPLPRRVVVVFATLIALLLSGCAGMSTTGFLAVHHGVGGSTVTGHTFLAAPGGRVRSYRPPTTSTTKPVAVPAATSRSYDPTLNPAKERALRVAGFLATEDVPDETPIVRGGQSEMPGSGEVFSGAQGQDLEDAARGVPHGTIRSSTAGDIRAGGGSVESTPEYNERVGETNYQHVGVTLGEGSNPFSDQFPNPVPKPGRFGGSDYPYGYMGP